MNCTTFLPWLLALSLLASFPAIAHSPSSSQVTIDDNTAQSLRLTVDTAVVDLAQLLPLDRNQDAQITWGEILGSLPDITAVVQPALSLQGDAGACELRALPQEAAISRYRDVAQLSLRFASDCPADVQAASFSFDLFYELDPDHRVYLRWPDADGLQVLTADHPLASPEASAGLSATGMLAEGVRHILGGYDHLLFLLLLILPAMGADRFKTRSLRLAGIVSAFTVAHSVTLALAATGVVSVPAKPVEVAIALSIVVAGLLNAWRPGHRTGWKLAAAFGLLHGFGFAGALADIGLGGGNLLRNLLAFNVGVEIGQLLVVLLMLPLLLLLARWPGYRQRLVPALSLIAVCTGAGWTAMRL